MRIQWFGQSCFMIISDSGVTIITDPFGKPLPYRLPDKQPDIVTVSHDHPDHNNTKALKGNFELVKKPVETEIKGVKIKGIVTYHDNSGGKKRGQNIVFKLTVDEITICHLGDLGHVLNEDQVQAIGDVDILLLPVGGGSQLILQMQQLLKLNCIPQSRFQCISVRRQWAFLGCCSIMLVISLI